MKFKKISTLILTITLAFSSVTAFAGTWKQSGTDYKGAPAWKYRNDDGSLVKEGWKLIDGDWYYFSFGTMEHDEYIYEELSNGLNDQSKPVYCVGSDGKMVKGGWYKENDKDSVFTDKDGKIVAGFFFVNDVLNFVGESQVDGYTISPVETTFRGEFWERFQGVDGKTHKLHFIYDGGKVLELDGNPIKADDAFYKTIPYIPKYDLQGNLVGELKN